MIWKFVGKGVIGRETIDPTLAHCPTTLPVISIVLLAVWLTIIWLDKQQHEVTTHPLSIRNVPVQFGVGDITPMQLRGVEVVVLGQLGVTEIVGSSFMKTEVSKCSHNL